MTLYGQNKVANDMAPIEIWPNVIALKVDDIQKGPTNTPRLTFKFNKRNDTIQTLNVTYSWYPIGYTSYCTCHTTSHMIAPNLSEITIENPVMKHFGVYQVLANIYDSDLLAGQYGQTMVAVIPDNSCEDYLTTSPFGMRTEFSTLDSEDSIRLAAERADMAGVRWVRENLRIPPRGKVNEKMLDASIGGLLSKSICVSGTFDLEWVLTPQTISTASPVMDNFFEQMTGIVQRYSTFGKRGISVWELTSSKTPLSNLSPMLYAELFEKTQGIVRKNGNGTAIMAEDGGQEWTSKAVDALKKIDEKDAGDFDGMVFSGRFSNQGKENINAWGALLASKNNHYSSQMTSDSIWLTDIGWVANHSSSWQERQADFLVQGYVRAMASGYGKIFWQMFINQGKDETGISYGLLDQSDFSPRISYVSYAAMVHMLENFKFIKMDTLGSGINIYTFKSTVDDTETVVIWCDKDAGTLTKPDDMVLDCDWVMYDQFANGTLWEKDKEAMLSVSRTPTYIRSPKGGIAQTLANWTQLGFPQISMSINNPPRLNNGDTLTVTIHNASMNSVTGTLSILCPEIVFETTATVSLVPSQTLSVPMRIKEIRKTETNDYSVAIGLSPENDSPPYIKLISLKEQIAPKSNMTNLDCNLNEWKHVLPVHCLLRQNMTEIKPCMDWMVSATLKFKYDETNIYAAVFIDKRSEKNFFVTTGEGFTPTLKMIFAPRDKNGTLITRYPFDFAIRETDAQFDTVYRSNQANGVTLARKTVLNTLHDIQTTIMEIAIPRTLIPQFDQARGNKMDIGIEFVDDELARNIEKSQPDSFENIYDKEEQTLLTFEFM